MKKLSFVRKKRSLANVKVTAPQHFCQQSVARTKQPLAMPPRNICDLKTLLGRANGGFGLLNVQDVCGAVTSHARLSIGVERTRRKFRKTRL